MVLFVGVEMTSGRRAARNLPGIASNNRGSLRSHWDHPQPKLANRRTPARSARGKAGAKTSPVPSAGQSSLAMTSPATRKDAAAIQRSPGVPDPETEDAKVTLGPQLEADPGAAEPAAAAHRRVPAMVTGQRPSVEILPEPEEPAHEVGALQERLDGIQHQLDQLGRTIASQAQRETPADPVRQTLELLRELRRARDLEEPLAQDPSSLLAEADLDKPGIFPDEKSDSGPRSGDAGAARTPDASDPGAASTKPRMATRIYRPRYLTATALRALVEPLLTRGIGKAAAAKLDTNESSPAAGGDLASAPQTALVVRDLPAALQKIDQLVLRLDVAPLPVLIEATVVTVRLDGELPQGIDLRDVAGAGQSFVITPAESAVPGSASRAGTKAAPRDASPSGVQAGPVLTHGFGLKCGVLRGDPREFLAALQTAAPSRSLNSWQLNVLNRQTAQLMLQDALGPDGPAPSRATAGTILKIRPIVTKKGVQIDIQRRVDRDVAPSAVWSAALTSQLTLREGETAVVAGFFAEHAEAQGAGGAGQLPFLAQLFRESAAAPERTETIVLLTPHIIRPPTEIAGRVSRKKHSKLKGAARPLPTQTAGNRGGAGLKPVSQAAASSPLRTVPGDGSSKPPTAGAAAPYAPRRLQTPPAGSIPPDDGTLPAGEAAEDSLDLIPVLKLPRKVLLRPEIRPAGDPP
jgi:hypothetical protein